MSVARLFGPHCTSGSRSVSQSATFCDSFFCPITKKSARHQTSGLCLRHLCNGAEGESRTPTPLRELDPEPSVSTNSTTSARKRLLHVLAPFGKSFFEGLKKNLFPGAHEAHFSPILSQDRSSPPDTVPGLPQGLPGSSGERGTVCSGKVIRNTALQTKKSACHQTSGLAFVICAMVPKGRVELPLPCEN